MNRRIYLSERNLSKQVRVEGHSFHQTPYDMFACFYCFVMFVGVVIGWEFEKSSDFRTTFTGSYKNKSIWLEFLVAFFCSHPYHLWSKNKNFFSGPYRVLFVKKCVIFLSDSSDLSKKFKSLNFLKRIAGQDDRPLNSKIPKTMVGSNKSF